jgi:hypothetical protein
MRASTIACTGAILLFSATAHAGRSCHEVSDIVGERNCSRYGDMWSRERTIPIVLGLGLVHGSIAPDDRHWSANFGKNQSTAYEFEGRDLGTSVGMWGPDLRIHAFAAPWLYFGTDWAILFGHGDTSPFRAGDYQVTPASGVNLVDGRFAFVTGLRTSLGSSVSLRVEALTGVEIIGLRQTATSSTNTVGTASATHVDFLLSTRFVLDFWSTPWTTFGVWMGGKPLHPNDLDFGLNLAIHGRPHDG